MRSGAPVVLAVVVAFLEVGCASGGGYTSLAIGSDGLGLIGTGTPNGFLMVAHCKNIACTSATLSVLDHHGGGFTSIAVGADALGLISFVDVGKEGTGRQQLSVAHCENVACTRALVSVIDDSQAASPAYTSLVIGKDARGLISYRDYYDGTLLVGHCDDIECTHATVTTLDRAAGTVGADSTIVIGSDGLGLIAYDGREGGLKVAHCKNISCTSASINTVDAAGGYPDVAIGRDGLGLISHTDSETGGSLRVAHCANVACTRADVHSIIDREGPHGRVGEYTSLAIGHDGLGLISYRGSLSSFLDQDLRVAHCQDVACRSAVVTTVDHQANGDDVGLYTSLAVGHDRLGLISYWDATAPALKVAHCRDALCASATLSILDRGGSLTGSMQDNAVRVQNACASGNAQACDALEQFHEACASGNAQACNALRELAEK